MAKKSKKSSQPKKRVKHPAKKAARKAIHPKIKKTGHLKKKAGKVSSRAKSKKGGAAHEKEINELIERGRPRGFVTDNEILYYFPKIEDDVTLLDEIYDRLEKAGVKVVETTALIDFSKDEDEKDLAAGDEASFEGDVPDAVQMYLREIGKTPLLTKDEERELAKAAE